MAKKSDDATFHAKLVSSPTEAKMAFGLRYDVYIAEQGKAYPSADHSNRMLTDHLDSEASIVLVHDDLGRACGTLRANWLTSSRIVKEFEIVFDFTRFNELPKHSICICGRLAVLPEYRNATVRNLLFEEIYTIALSRGTRLCFVMCATNLTRLFRSYGFREFASPIIDPVVGRLHRFVLALRDLPYLESLNSPFFHLGQRQGFTIEEPDLLKQCSN